MRSLSSVYVRYLAYNLISHKTDIAKGRRQRAEGRSQEERRLYSKLFNLFQLDSYFRHAALSENSTSFIIERDEDGY
jgi:hypothetical protein